MDELAAARALFHDFIERYEETTAALLSWHASWGSPSPKAKPRQVLEIADARNTLLAITRIVETIEKIRQSVSKADLLRVLNEVGRITEIHLTAIVVQAGALVEPDLRKKLTAVVEEQREAIKQGWLAIRVA